MIFNLLILLSALLTIRAEYYGPPWQIYLFKPLTTSLLLLLALRTQSPAFYRYAIVLGIFCSLIGDIFLMLPSDRFILGLVSFLIAHLFYIAAFSSKAAWQLSPWSILPFALSAIILLSILLPHAVNLQWPVAIYGVVLVTMAWRAAVAWNVTRETKALWAFIGAVLFVISDATLAYNRFLQNFELARAMVLSTYFTAQWLIARSV